MIVAILWKCECYGLEPQYILVDHRVRCLGPLVAVTPTITGKLRVAELEVEDPLMVSVVLELVQNGEQLSVRVVGVLVESLLLAGEQAPARVVAEHLHKAVPGAQGGGVDPGREQQQHCSYTQAAAHHCSAHCYDDMMGCCEI